MRFDLSPRGRFTSSARSRLRLMIRLAAETTSAPVKLIFWRSNQIRHISITATTSLLASSSSLVVIPETPASPGLPPPGAPAQWAETVGLAPATILLTVELSTGPLGQTSPAAKPSDSVD
jgi:hypothetical protein